MIGICYSTVANCYISNSYVVSMGSSVTEFPNFRAALHVNNPLWWLLRSEESLLKYAFKIGQPYNKIINSNITTNCE